MDRITVAEAERDFPALLNRVYSQGISFELQRGDSVIAYLCPAQPQSALKIHDLAAFLDGLPKLQDDADAFSEDLRSIRRELPPEADPWG